MKTLEEALNNAEFAMINLTAKYTGFTSEDPMDDTFVVDEQVKIIDRKAEYDVILFSWGDTLSLTTNRLDGSGCWMLRDEKEME